MFEINSFQKKVLYNFLIVILLVLSFLSGSLSVKIEAQKQTQPIKVIDDLDAPGTLEDLLELIKEDHSEPCPVCDCAEQEKDKEDISNIISEGLYVASKSSSSKKFHSSTSSTAKRIKDENKVYFSSKEEALAAGYSPGSSVK